MSVLRILGYFVGEAVTSLVRSWKVSLLAISTIAMSVFIAGTFLLLSDNLTRLVREWRQEAKIIVYLADETSDPDLDRVADLLMGPRWVVDTDLVSADEARARFEETFPSVKDLLQTWQDEPLPPSIEVSFDSDLVDTARFESWLAELRADPAVTAIDDDRDWLRQLDALMGILRGLALVTGSALLGAAVFTIASVIRLAAYLYRDEIAVMRLVGATEFYIRGPFYFEGLIQGLTGSMLALAGLYLAFVFLNPRSSTLLLGTTLIDNFLSWTAILGLVLIGAAAGTFGAVMSLRRESLSPD
ncbi:MAG: ABC transporter permease [Acidobacteriota bacterium]